MAPVESQKQPPTRQYQPGVRTSRGYIAHPRSGYEADEEKRQGSPGIQNHTVLNRSSGGGSGRGPPRSAPPGGDDGDASDEDSSSSDSSSGGGHQPGNPAQNDHSSDSDLSSTSEESDWGSDIQSVDGMGNLSDPGFMLVVRNEPTLRDPAEGIELPKVCLRMTSEDPLHQGWEIANFLTVRGNPHRLKRALSNLVRTNEAVESREHLPARRVLEDLASSTRNRKFRSPYELEQATNPDVAWGFEVNFLLGMLTVYAPPRVGGLVRRGNFFRDALRQDGDRVPGLIYRYRFHELSSFDSEEAFRRDVLSRFNTEATEHYWISMLQGLHSPAQLDETPTESTSPSVTTPSSTEDGETVNGYPVPPLIPTYATHPAPWGHEQHMPGPHNHMAQGAPPVFGNGPGTPTDHYDGGYTGGQGGNHTADAPPQGPQTPNLAFPGGYRGGAIGGLPPGPRLRYTDDPDSDDDVEDERPSRPLPALRQYTSRNGPVTWGGSGFRSNIGATETPDRSWTAPSSNYYDTYEPTSPNQGYSPLARSEDHNSRDDSNASTEILDQNNGGEGPARRSPVSYQTNGPPARLFTQQPTSEGHGSLEAGNNASDQGQGNEENIPPFYRFDTVRPPPGPRTPLPVYDRLLQYRDYRPIDSDSDSSVDLRRESYGDDDGSPTLRVRAAIRQTEDRTVDASPETPSFRRAREAWRRGPRTMSPAAIRDTVEHDSEDEDSRPVQQPRHMLSPGALRYRIFEDDLPDLGGPARAATEDDLPDYESDPHELPALTRGRAPSPSARRCSAADASPGPPDFALDPRALSPKDAGYAADESDSESDSTFGSDSDSESDPGLDSGSSDSSSDSDSDESPGPPDTARPPPRSDGDPPASPDLEREAQDAYPVYGYAASLEPTPAPARESEEIVFRDPGWSSPSREPVDEDVEPRTMTPPVGGGYIHEDAYPHPLPPARNDNENGEQEKGCGEDCEEGQDVDSSAGENTYEALLAEEQRLMQEYTALLEEQSRQPTSARRMLVSADYYSSPEPEERVELGAGDGGYISVGSSPP